MALDAIARRHGIGPWRRRFQGVAAEGTLAGERVLLLLPGTYMNDSGLRGGRSRRISTRSVSPTSWCSTTRSISPPAKVRVKTGGGNAGHNGLRSISSHVGNDYRRVRIGVGHPGDKDLVEPYVLGDFAKAERPWVEALCEIIADNAALIAKGDDAAFQNKVHLAMQGKGFGEPAPRTAAATP